MPSRLLVTDWLLLRLSDSMPCTSLNYVTEMSVEKRRNCKPGIELRDNGDVGSTHHSEEQLP